MDIRIFKYIVSIYKFFLLLIGYIEKKNLLPEEVIIKFAKLSYPKSNIQKDEKDTEKIRALNSDEEDVINQEALDKAFKF